MAWRSLFGRGRWMLAVAALGTLCWALLPLLQIQDNDVHHIPSAVITSQGSKHSKGLEKREVLTLEAKKEDVQHLKEENALVKVTSKYNTAGLGHSVGDYLQYDEVFSNTTWVQWPLLVFSTMGRLGNCLNSYATALSFHGAHQATFAVTEDIFKRVASVLARENLVLPVLSRDMLLDVQDMDIVEKVEPDYLKDDMVSHLLPTILRAVREYQDSGQEKIFILEGYPNRMRMLAGHHLKIRRSFSIRPDLQAKAWSFLDRVRTSKGEDVTFVGLHIRRGDYVSYMETYHKCSVPGPQYYWKAMNHYRRSVSKPVFVVCSDDLPHARRHFENATDVVFSDLSLPEEDLALLAACSQSIMTVGSFGFWASYLAGGPVVYPLVNGCTFAPYVHPDTLGPQGYSNWLAI